MILLFTALALCTCIYVAAPWFVLEDAPQTTNSSTQLIEQKQRLLKAFATLEFDFQTQKLSAEDFTMQKASLLSELQEIYTLIDSSALKASHGK